MNELVSLMRGDKPRIAYFEATKLEVPLPDNWFYHNEGGRKVHPLMPREEFFRSTLFSRVKAIERGYIERGFEEGIISESQREEELGFVEESYLHRVMQNAFGSVAQGITLKLEFDGEKHLHTLYTLTRDPAYNFFIQAHEEAHAIDKIPRGNELLSKKIAKDRKYRNSWSIENITDKEVAADYSALHALLASGTPVEMVEELVEERRDSRRELKKAWRSYQQGDKSFLERNFPWIFGR